jgi:hypothetical protein
MEKRIIRTKLANREEVFKILAIGEATGYPVLLEGSPGVGKTAALLDYTSAKYSSKEDAMLNTFILETDEGTKTAEIKGRIDIEKLVTEKQYGIVSPIVSATSVLINEVDKASAGLRNSMLGVMNEKYLFNGSEKVKCNWEIFCASCNEIPNEEIGNPFWDRFIIKHKVGRINKSQMLKYYDEIISEKTEREITLNIPNAEDLKEVKLNKDKLSKFVELCYGDLSDRTLSYVPKLISAVGIVYKYNSNKSIVKTAEILLGYEKAKQLSKLIEPESLTKVRSQIDLIATLSDYDMITNQIKLIEGELSNSISKGEIKSEELEEISEEITFALSNNSNYTKKDNI